MSSLISTMETSASDDCFFSLDSREESVALSQSPEADKYNIIRNEVVDLKWRQGMTGTHVSRRRWKKKTMVKLGQTGFLTCRKSQVQGQPRFSLSLFSGESEECREK